jgi:hypothetical protein
MAAYIPTSTRHLVAERANYACEYCLIPQSSTIKHQIEHILPQQHGGGSEENNLAFSCPKCNRYKGTNVAAYDTETGALTPLFNPRTQVWSKHFRIEYGVITPLTPEGRVTERIFRFNDLERVEERREQIEAGLIK